MSEEGELRVFTVTGEAAKSLSGGMKKRRTTRKKGGEEGVPVINVPHKDMELPPPLTSSNSSNVKLNAVKVNNVPTQPTPPVMPVKVQPPPPQPQPNNSIPEPVVGGDDKKFKVELTKKHESKKVQLHPKKDEPQKVAVPKKMETRKRNRKVLLGVSVLHRRMTRAKKMQKKAKDMPLDKLKEELIQKKLIKSTSKAPESVLRQIAADAQIVAGKAL